jgi:hypothetical protein
MVIIQVENNKETLDLNYTLGPGDLTDIHTAVYPIAAEYIILKYTWNVLLCRSCVRPQKYMKKFKKIK